MGHTLDFYLTDTPPWLDVFRLQELGVVIFFVLSGYLIAYSSDRQQQRPDSRFSDYLRSRAVRIYATLIPALLLIALLDALFSREFARDFSTDNSLFTALINLLHLQEYPFSAWPFFGTGYPLWSLSVEWWLYMGFGVLAFRDAWRRWYSYPLLLLACGSFLYNCVAGNAPGLVHAWTLGAVGYWLLRPGNRASAQRILLAAALLSIGAGWIVSAPRSIGLAYHPATMLITGLVMLAGLWWLQRTSINNTGNPLFRLIRTGAASSFSLYLLHFSILASGYNWYGVMADFWLILVAVVVCNLVAVVFAHWCEWHWNPVKGYHHGRDL